MDWIISIFVVPIKLAYFGIFELIQSFVKVPGIALLVLSLVSVSLMLPLEKIVKPIIAREHLMESILSPQVMSIKNSLSGGEQHEALKRLYKRYRYSPIYSIRSTFGILIQLPFLLGAFLMLSDYDGLKDVSFGAIKDLGAPDGLLFGFNLLPLLMTIINILTAWISRLQRKEFIQSLFISIVFLSILYNSPSALLIYWTANNFLHLIRAIIDRCSNKFNIIKLTYDRFKSLTKRIIYKTNFSTIVTLLLLSIGLILKATGDLLNKNVLLNLFYLDVAVIVFIFSIPVFTFLCRLWYVNNKNVCIFVQQISSLVILIFSVYTICLIIGFSVFSLPVKHLNNYCVSSALMLILWRYYRNIGIGNKFIDNKISLEHTANIRLFTIGFLLLFITIFLLLPLRFYVQNYQSLWFSGVSLLSYVCLLGSITGLILLVARKLTIPRHISVLTLLVTTCVIIQSFLWPQQIKEFIGVSYNWLESPLTWLNLFLWLSLLIFGTWLCINKPSFQKIIIYFNIFVIVVSAVNIFRQAEIAYSKTRDSIYSTLAFNKLNQFGLADENIIIFLLDTLSQDTLESLAKTDTEEFSRLFRGFTWYKNNLGSGPLTSYAIPYIFTGEHIHKGEEYPRYLNRIYSNESFLDLAKNEGYQVRIYSLGEIFPKIVASKIENAIAIQTWGYAKINHPAKRAFISLMLYNIVPDIIRSRMNLNPALFDFNKPSFTSSFDPYSEDDPLFYEDFNRNPFTVNRSGKDFIFYHLHGAHPPFRTDIEGKWIPWDKPDTTEHTQVLGCLRQLQRMFDRLHQIGKFKDSTIVVMADHGAHLQVKESYPILLVKKSGVDVDLELTTSTVPTGHKGMLASILQTGSPSVLEERIVIDSDSNLWKAPKILSKNVEEFIPIEQIESVGDLFQVNGFDFAEFWGRRMFVSASIKFPQTESQILKLIFNNPAPECNGYINFEEYGSKKRIYVGREFGRVLYQRNSPSLRIIPECENKPYVNNENHFRTYDTIRLKYGLFDILDRNTLAGEFYQPNINKTISLGGSGPHEKVFFSGFSVTENFGRWMNGLEAHFAILNPIDSGTIKFKVIPFLHQNLKTQTLLVKNDSGELISQFNIDSEREIELDIQKFKSQFAGFPLLKITFETPNAQSPMSVGLNKDSRLLSFALLEMRLCTN